MRTSAPAATQRTRNPAAGMMRQAVKRHPLAGFFVLATALSWAAWIPLALTGQVVRAGNGWPSHMPGIAGPLLAALIVTYATRGSSGIRDLITRMARWRVGL